MASELSRADSILIPVSETGHRIGEHHQNAIVPDAVVVHIRDLYEHSGLTRAEIARETGVSLSAVISYVTYRRRASQPADWKRVPNSAVVTPYQSESEKSNEISNG